MGTNCSTSSATSLRGQEPANQRGVHQGSRSAIRGGNAELRVSMRSNQSTENARSVSGVTQGAHATLSTRPPPPSSRVQRSLPDLAPMSGRENSDEPNSFSWTNNPPVIYSGRASVEQAAARAEMITMLNQQRRRQPHQDRQENQENERTIQRSRAVRLEYSNGDVYEGEVITLLVPMVVPKTNDTEKIEYDRMYRGPGNIVIVNQRAGGSANLIIHPVSPFLPLPFTTSADDVTNEETNADSDGNTSTTDDVPETLKTDKQDAHQYYYDDTAIITEMLKLIKQRFSEYVAKYRTNASERSTLVADDLDRVHIHQVVLRHGHGVYTWSGSHAFDSSNRSNQQHCNENTLDESNKVSNKNISSPGNHENDEALRLKDGGPAQYRGQWLLGAMHSLSGGSGTNGRSFYRTPDGKLLVGPIMFNNRLHNFFSNPHHIEAESNSIDFRSHVDSTHYPQTNKTARGCEVTSSDDDQEHDEAKRREDAQARQHAVVLNKKMLDVMRGRFVTTNGGKASDKYSSSNRMHEMLMQEVLVNRKWNSHIKTPTSYTATGTLLNDDGIVLHFPDGATYRYGTFVDNSIHIASRVIAPESKLGKALMTRQEEVAVTAQNPPSNMNTINTEISSVNFNEAFDSLIGIGKASLFTFGNCCKSTGDEGDDFSSLCLSSDNSESDAESNIGESVRVGATEEKNDNFCSHSDAGIKSTVLSKEKREFFFIKDRAVLDCLALDSENNVYEGATDIDNSSSDCKSMWKILKENENNATAETVTQRKPGPCLERKVTSHWEAVCGSPIGVTVPIYVDPTAISHSDMTNPAADHVYNYHNEINSRCNTPFPQPEHSLERSSYRPSHGQHKRDDSNNDLFYPCTARRATLSNHHNHSRKMNLTPPPLSNTTSFFNPHLQHQYSPNLSSRLIVEPDDIVHLAIEMVLPPPDACRPPAAPPAVYEISLPSSLAPLANGRARLKSRYVQVLSASSFSTAQENVDTSHQKDSLKTSRTRTCTGGTDICATPQRSLLQPLPGLLPQLAAEEQFQLFDNIPFTCSQLSKHSLDDTSASDEHISASPLTQEVVTLNMKKKKMSRKDRGSTNHPEQANNAEMSLACPSTDSIAKHVSTTRKRTSERGLRSRRCLSAATTRRRYAIGDRSMENTASKNRQKSRATSVEPPGVYQREGDQLIWLFSGEIECHAEDERASITLPIGPGTLALFVRHPSENQSSTHEWKLQEAYTGVFRRQRLARPPKTAQGQLSSLNLDPQARLNGFGVYINYSRGDSYRGHFRQGRFDGPGTYRWGLKRGAGAAFSAHNPESCVEFPPATVAAAFRGTFYKGKIYGVGRFWTSRYDSKNVQKLPSRHAPRQVAWYGVSVARARSYIIALASAEFAPQVAGSVKSEFTPTTSVAKLMSSLSTTCQGSSAGSSTITSWRCRVCGKIHIRKAHLCDGCGFLRGAAPVPWTASVTSSRPNRPADASVTITRICRIDGHAIDEESDTPAALPSTLSTLVPSTSRFRFNSSSNKNAQHTLEEERDKLCVICLSAPLSHVIVPCGHLCLCKECAQSESPLTRCPICRSPIDMKVQLYTV